jgi:CDP-glycerol glycerophosphotransferase (TagB/SpsB family)
MMSRLKKLFIARLLDYLLPVRQRRVCFVTRANVPLSGNLRIMLDTLADQADLEIGFFKEGPILEDTLQVLGEKGVSVMQRYSLESLRFLLSSQTIVLSHSARDAYITRRKSGRRVINLWHGVALKRIENLMPQQGNVQSYAKRQGLIQRNARIYDAMIASNAVDRLVNALAFGLPHHKVHPIGLPRLDYLKPGYPWPTDLARQQQQLRQALQGRQLVLYAPTFRDSGTPLSELLPPEAREAIRRFCAQTGSVLGVRPHPYRVHELADLCDGEHIIDLSPQRFPESAILLTAAHALVADYSSIWVDYLLLERPIVGHVPDLSTYTQRDRGFVYDMAAIFPGPFCQTWPQTLQAVEQAFRSGLCAMQQQRHQHARQLLLPPSQAIDQELRSACAALIKGQPFEVCQASFTFTEAPAT